MNRYYPSEHYDENDQPTGYGVWDSEADDWARQEDGMGYEEAERIASVLNNDRGLPAFRIKRSDGHTYVTSMAKGVTLQQAKDYFLGQSIGVEGPGGLETLVTVTNVEQI